MAFLEPEHLAAGAEAEAELRNDRRRLQPAARRRRGDHVACLVDDVEVNGVADHLAHAADGRLARAHAGDELGAFLELHQRAEAFDRAGAQFERRRVGDELAALGVVGVREQRLERHVDELRIAVEFLAVGVGKLRALDDGVDEVRPDDVRAMAPDVMRHRVLLTYEAEAENVSSDEVIGRVLATVPAP